MSTVDVQIIPPVQSADPPKFDRHVFDNSRPRAISAETGITWSDFRRMHIQYNEGGGRGHRTRRFVPKFAENDEQLQKVIAFSALLYGDQGTGKGTMAKRAGTVDAYTMAQLEQMTAVRFNALRSWQLEAGSMQSRMRATHVEAVETAGSYAARLASIAYLSWRLGYTSNQIVETMAGELSPKAVRVNLFRMVQRAEALGYETFPPRQRREGFRRHYRNCTGKVRIIDPSTVQPPLMAADPDYLRYKSFCERVGSPAMCEQQWQFTR